MVRPARTSFRPSRIAEWATGGFAIRLDGLGLRVGPDQSINRHRIAPEYRSTLDAAIVLSLSLRGDVTSAVLRKRTS
jgi:hypothetical protein